MRESIEALQITLLLTTLLLNLVMLLGFVYTFRLLIAALKQLAKMVNETPASTSETPGQAPQSTPPPEPIAPPAAAEAAPLPRFKCHRCKANLPEQPVSSQIEGLLTILIYKCRRCGKNTDINAATGECTNAPAISEGK